MTTQNTRRDDAVDLENFKLSPDEVARIIAAAQREQSEVIFKIAATVFAKLAALVQAVFRPISRAFAQAGSFDLLSRMSDHDLADLGISRADIPDYVVRGPVADHNGTAISSLAGWTPGAAASNDRQRAA
ncbi:MAG: DUF1127 domain-containing protein [Rhodospirillales bacterium]|nr:DUF1127 domain-containing protein [Rhodospirillales bacterium]